MELDGYVSRLRGQLAAAAAAGGGEAREVAERLSTALDPAVRLVLLEVLGDAAVEVTRGIAPGSVDVRLRGREPELVVTPPPAPPAPSPHAAAGVPPAAEGPEDGGTSRTTLRLPDHLKARVERAAAEDGLSVNSWLVRAVAAALDPSAAPGRPPGRGTGSFRGWAR